MRINKKSPKEEMVLLLFVFAMLIFFIIRWQIIITDSDETLAKGNVLIEKYERWGIN